MKFCGRCDQPILDGEEYSTHDIPAATGAGDTVYWHVEPCRPVPIQTAQVSPRY